MLKIAIHEPENGIRYIPFKQSAPTRSIALVWRKTTTRSQLIQQLVELISTVHAKEHS